jgi:hypothetical protein
MIAGFIWPPAISAHARLFEEHGGHDLSGKATGRCDIAL